MASLYAERIVTVVSPRRLVWHLVGFSDSSSSLQQAVFSHGFLTWELLFEKDLMLPSIFYFIYRTELFNHFEMFDNLYDLKLIYGRGGDGSHCS